MQAGTDPVFVGNQEYYLNSRAQSPRQVDLGSWLNFWPPRPSFSELRGLGSHPQLKHRSTCWVDLGSVLPLPGG